MPETDLDRALSESVEEVLEKMFFVSGLADAHADPSLAGSEIVAHLTFEGDPSGSLTMRVSSSAARSIAADFLGDEEYALSDQQVEEVVCELANMICGSVLSRVESTATFRLASPRLLPAQQPPSSEGAVAVQSVDIGKGTLTVFVQTGSPECSSAEKYAY